MLITRKFYIRRNNNKVNAIETGNIAIADLLSWSGLENCMHTTLYNHLSKTGRMNIIIEFNTFELF